MKRYRISKFFVNAGQNVARGPFASNAAAEAAKTETLQYLNARFGEIDINNKFNRYMALETPVLSVVEEHTWLLEDICNSYIAGNSYSALTGACCLGSGYSTT